MNYCFRAMAAETPSKYSDADVRRASDQANLAFRLALTYVDEFAAPTPAEAASARPSALDKIENVLNRQVPTGPAADFIRNNLAFLSSFGFEDLATYLHKIRRFGLLLFLDDWAVARCLGNSVVVATDAAGWRHVARGPRGPREPREPAAMRRAPARHGGAGPRGARPPRGGAPRDTARPGAVRVAARPGSATAPRGSQKPTIDLMAVCSDFEYPELALQGSALQGAAVNVSQTKAPETPRKTVADWCEPEVAAPTASPMAAPTAAPEVEQSWADMI